MTLDDLHPLADERQKIANLFELLGNTKGWAGALSELYGQIFVLGESLDLLVRPSRGVEFGNQKARRAFMANIMSGRMGDYLEWLQENQQYANK